jgi:hypothetical protein
VIFLITDFKAVTFGGISLKTLLFDDEPEGAADL